MSDTRQKEGNGIIKESQYFTDGSNKPTHYGNILLNEELLEKVRKNGYVLPLSVWKRKSEWGKFFSVAVDIFTLEGKKKQQAEQQQQQQHGESDVPF